MQQSTLKQIDFKIPVDIICPIAQQIMSDPVLLIGSGHTYEREAIVEWLEKNDTDPVTGLKISSKDMVPNFLAKKMIIGFLEAHQKTNPALLEAVYLPCALKKNVTEATEQNDVARLLALIEKDKRLLTIHLNEKGQNALMLASEKHQLDTMSWLLRHAKTCVDEADLSGNTPLHYAALSGSQDGVQLLMKHGASIKKMNQMNKTPLTLAREQGHNALAELMQINHQKRKLKPLIKPLKQEIVRQQVEIKHQQAKLALLETKIATLESELHQVKAPLPQAKAELAPVKPIDRPIKIVDTQRDTMLPKTSNTFFEEESQKILSAISDQTFSFWATAPVVRLPKSDLQQVTVKAQSIVNPVIPEDLAALLKWDTEGHLVEVEKLLQKNPELAVMTGTVTDLSGRKFNDITAFQYAVLALDSEMWELILKFMDKAKAAEQLADLQANPKKYGCDDAYCHIGTSSLASYMQSHAQWDREERCEFWQSRVNSEQKAFPAWLIYAMCEEGSDVAWVKKDLKSIKINRQYEKNHLGRWFKELFTVNDYLSVGPQSNAFLRGTHEYACAQRQTQSNISLSHDYEVEASAKQLCHEALARLKTELLGNKALIDALLKGDLELVKKLESEGASFLLSDKITGLYPLVAAVYGCNLELVRYVEGKLQGEAPEQWAKVDTQEFAHRLDSQMPTPLPENATYGDLRNWYIKHEKAPWCSAYDLKVLNGMNCNHWGLGREWKNRLEKFCCDGEYWNVPYSDIWSQLIDRSPSYRDQKQHNWPSILSAPSVKIHKDVVKAIGDDLNTIKEMVEANVSKSLTRCNM